MSASAVASATSTGRHFNFDALVGVEFSPHLFYSSDALAGVGFFPSPALYAGGDGGSTKVSASAVASATFAGRSAQTLVFIVP